MKFIYINEIEKMDPTRITIIDIRKQEDYSRNTIPYAMNIPIEKFQNGIPDLDKTKPVYILCYTGEKGEAIVEQLEEAGYDAANISGGYRAFLRLQLSRMVETKSAMEEKTKEIERSLIKKFRKSIWRKFTKAVQEYQLIQPGDKIAVCISGGKDSMLMAKLFQELQKHGKIPFELVFLVMNPGYNQDNWKIIQDNAKLLGIPLTVFESDIFNIVAGVDKNPCYLCARMRRGYLYSNAKKLGCNKIALGHHFDDVIEANIFKSVHNINLRTIIGYHKDGEKYHYDDVR